MPSLVIMLSQDDAKLRITRSTMSKFPVAITATGLVTGVGLDSASSCAAIRAAIDNFQETRFVDSGGEWIQGCEVPLEKPWRGTDKLAKISALAITECCNSHSLNPEQLPLILCLSEKNRPGRPQGYGNSIFFALQTELGFQFRGHTSLVEQGRVSFTVALQQARSLLYQKGFTHVLIAAVDSLLDSTAIKAYENQYRILTSGNSNGFIPGEAASAVIVQRPEPSEAPQLLCTGLGFGMEKATIDSEQPLRAEGLSQAVRGAFAEANQSMDTMDFRIVDVTGEQYWFKETALVLSRFLRVHKEGFPLWNPTDCVGEVGAAIGGIMVAYGKSAYDKGFDDGANLMMHNSNDDGRRSAAVFQYGVFG